MTATQLSAVRSALRRPVREAVGYRPYVLRQSVGCPWPRSPRSRRTPLRFVRMRRSPRERAVSWSKGRGRRSARRCSAGLFSRYRHDYPAVIVELFCSAESFDCNWWHGWWLFDRRRDELGNHWRVESGVRTADRPWPPAAYVACGSARSEQVA